MNGLTEAADKDLYRLRRYQLGIGEGTVDFPPGNCTPLECNVVFLNGGKLALCIYVCIKMYAGELAYDGHP